MTHPKLTTRERKVKALLLSGHSRHAIASKLRISKSTVYDIVASLEHYGEIRAIPGTKNPVVYRIPIPSRLSPLRGDVAGIPETTDGPSKITAPPEIRRISRTSTSREST